MASFPFSCVQAFLWHVTFFDFFLTLDEDFQNLWTMVKMIQSPGGNDGRDPNDQRAYQAKMDELLLRERQAKIRQVRKF